MIKVQVKDIKLIDPAKLHLNPDNRNEHPKSQIEQLKKLITYQGFRQPIVVSMRTNLVVAGHGRIIAALELGMKEVPVSFQEFDDAAQEWAYMISDNAIQSQSVLDMAAINMELPDWGPEFDIDTLGIKDFVLDMSEKMTEELVPSDPKITTCPECSHKWVK